MIADQFVNSVISYGYSFDPQHLYGPYFGSVAKTSTGVPAARRFAAPARR